MLVTPAEKLSILVEDAPFLAVLMTAEGEGENQRLTFTTNMGDIVTAGPAHGLRFSPEKMLTSSVGTSMPFSARYTVTRFGFGAPVKM